MSSAWEQSTVANWSMTELSRCYVSKPCDTAGIAHALDTARAQGLTVITHAAGHSYTDAALNTNGGVIDITGMRRILCWDPERGVMEVEPGVTLREMVRLSLPDRWWPAITPSTADATIGGCVAMNVTGKNAWKCGPFGNQVLSLTLLLASGELLTLSPVANPQLFGAVVGSAGLLGIITSMTLQLQRIASGSVDMVLRPAAALNELLEIFEEEQSADFLEAWVDGFAEGRDLGRGIVTRTTHSDMRHADATHAPASGLAEQLQGQFARWSGRVGRLALNGSVRTVRATNRMKSV
jgi:FAD/FMN-containing dehydrogenase